MNLNDLRRDIAMYQRNLEREQELTVALSVTDWNATAEIIIGGQKRQFATGLPTAGMVNRIQNELTNVRAQIAAFEAAHGIIP